MKFQKNPILKLVCTDGWTRPKQYNPSTFPKLINMKQIYFLSHKPNTIGLQNSLVDSILALV